MSVLEGELASLQKSVADQKAQLKATMEGYEGQLKATTAKIGKLAAVEQELDAKKVCLLIIITTKIGKLAAVNTS
jgi:hypothetical protein